MVCEQTMTKLRDAACGYVLDYNWCIFPLMPMGKKPDGNLVPNGMKEASRYAPDVLYWWEREPMANIGLNCRMSGLLVLDVDPRNGGDDSMIRLCKELTPLPATKWSVTPTLGSHLLFKHPGDFEFRKELAPGVDIKDRGYIVLPPSCREMGDYAWVGMGPVAELPDDWIERAIRTEEFNAPCERSQHQLMQIPAEEYIETLTGRQASGRWVKCPFHKGGEERTPSLKVQDSIWCCFVCEPWGGKQHAGGNVLDFCAKLWGYPLPLAGADLMECKARAERELNAPHAST